MGDRALIQLRNSDGDISPVLYLHWDGNRAGKIIYDTHMRMKGRGDDLDYTFARLVQEAVGDDPGNTSYGVSNSVAPLSADNSHGDAGCFLVDIATDNWVVYAGGGYGIESVSEYKLEIKELG